MWDSLSIDGPSEHLSLAVTLIDIQLLPQISWHAICYVSNTCSKKAPHFPISCRKTIYKIVTHALSGIDLEPVKDVFLPTKICKHSELSLSSPLAVSSSEALVHHHCFQSCHSEKRWALNSWGGRDGLQLPLCPLLPLFIHSGFHSFPFLSACSEDFFLFLPRVVYSSQEHLDPL